MLSDPVAEAFGLIHRHPRVKISAVCTGGDGTGHFCDSEILDFRWVFDDLDFRVVFPFILNFRAGFTVVVPGQFFSFWILNREL